MRVYLDDVEITPTEPTLGACLTAGADQSRDAGRVVVEVWADGAPIPEEDLAEPPARSPYAAEVRLVSAEPRSLVRTVMLDVAETLDETCETQKRAADAIQIGQSSTGLTDLGESLRSWDTVRRVVEEGCALLRLPGAGGADATVLEETLIVDLGQTLESVKEALAREDWALLADLLAYDLHDQAQRWQEELRRLAGTVQSSS